MLVRRLNLNLLSTSAQRGGVVFQLGRSFGKKNSTKNNKDKGAIPVGALPVIDYDVIQSDMELYRVSTYLRNNYAKIQASRFDPRMIDQMKVEVEGKTVSMSSVAQVAAKTPLSFLITPFDPSNVPFVMKTLKSSNLNLNPQIDKNAVRIQIPKTTKETRQKLIKQVATECEQQKSKLRAVRKRYMDKVRVIEKSKTVAKDDIDVMKKKIDKITDIVSKEMTEMMKQKEHELEI